MNIVEALNITKKQGKRVRPVGCEKAYMVYEKHGILKGEYAVRHIKNNEIIRNYDVLGIEDVLADWEVVEEKPSKQTQHKIDSMKFQIVRYCDKNADYDGCYDCKIKCVCHTKQYNPLIKILDDWSLKEIVEAYHILKKEGEI